MTILTVTAKGQVTLEKEFLEQLGIKPGDRLNIEVLPDGRLEVAAVKERGKGTLEDFFNAIPNGVNIHATIDDIQRAIEDGWAGKVRFDYNP